MKLLRAHGLGNDYLVLEHGPALDEALVRALCHRHTGVGSDGILEPMAAPEADYGVRIWNPDGSRAEKSGNGLRIFARWLHEVRGAPDHFSIWTGSHSVSCEVGPHKISVDMGRASVQDPEAIEVVGQSLTGLAVSTGNPHFVVFRDEALDSLPWRAWGAALERHPRFPQRTNVQIARVCDVDRVELRIWERGAGETSASGSSSCAVVAAAVATGRLRPGPIRVSMPGGVLQVAIDAQLALRLTGPVVVVGRVEVDPRWLAAARAQQP